MFQHTAARRRLKWLALLEHLKSCFNTQPPEGGCWHGTLSDRRRRGFNTQPPEGGCSKTSTAKTQHTTFQHTAARRRLKDGKAQLAEIAGFNTQPPEGGWHHAARVLRCQRVSTHSRPKAAVTFETLWKKLPKVSTHSRPKAADTLDDEAKERGHVSTHSRPKAAEDVQSLSIQNFAVSTHSRPKAAAHDVNDLQCIFRVSTHSRPKAAVVNHLQLHKSKLCFNTQPPEGGCPPI